MADYQTFDFHRNGTYYRRSRALPLYMGCDDSGRPYTLPCRATISRWGFQKSRFNRPTDAYLTDEGIWVRIQNVPTDFVGDEPTAWTHMFVPIRKGTRLNDRYARYTREEGDVAEGISLVMESDGILGSATAKDGTVVATGDMGPERMRAALAMAPAKRGRKPKAA